MKKIIVANWKMNPQNLFEAKKLFNLIAKKITNKPEFLGKIEIVICPPFVYLPFFKTKNNFLKLGAQNVFWEEKGPFTGEISPLMLKEFNVNYVIVGHSERRNILHETDDMVNKKLQILLKFKMNPILCIGESEEERRKRRTLFVLQSQLNSALQHIPKISSIIIAYEPVWAIGTGKACKEKDALEVLDFLKKNFPKNKVLYGGSVNSENALNFVRVGFDGLLIGGASLNQKEFLKIVKNIVFC